MYKVFFNVRQKKIQLKSELSVTSYVLWGWMLGPVKNLPITSWLLSAGGAMSRYWGYAGSTLFGHGVPEVVALSPRSSLQLIPQSSSPFWLQSPQCPTRATNTAYNKLTSFFTYLHIVISLYRSFSFFSDFFSKYIRLSNTQKWNFFHDTLAQLLWLQKS